MRTLQPPPSALSVAEAFARSINIVSGAGLHFEDAVASAGDVKLYANNDLTSGNTSATGDISLSSSAADIHTLGDIAGANVFFRAGGGVRVDSNIDTAGLLQVIADGTFGLGGTASANRITVASADIDLASGAQLGMRGTTASMTLAPNDPTAPLLIGGTGQAGTYILDSG